LQHCVAQKFQALIIEVIGLGLVPKARMGKRFRQQKRVPKFVTDAFLERTHRDRNYSTILKFATPEVTLSVP
jgi:ribosomal protein L39E